MGGRYYDVLLSEERNGFTIIVDKTWEEDISPADSFDTPDADEIIKGISDGNLDWFMLRVRALFEGVELGSAYLGACCYADASEVLRDGTAENLIQEALSEAMLTGKRIVAHIEAHSMRAT